MKKSYIKFKSLLLRNIKLYFSDKTVFYVSLMAPLILLLLFVLFLKSVYYNSFVNSLPSGFVFANADVPDAFVAGWLISAIMSVTCVTVSLGAGIIAVQDKITGAINDFNSSPVKKSMISFSYYLANFVSASLIVFSVLGLGFIYIAFMGWYLSLYDVILIVLNTLILTLFGCGLSTIINSFIKSEGGITAVSALSSSVYGFICGAYMPLSQFGSTFSNIFGFNPGLYASILFKNLFTRGIIKEMALIPAEVIKGIKDAFDLNFYFFGSNVSQNIMWIITSLAVIVLFGIVILIANKDKLTKNR